jgi:hypothetical protein
MSVIIGAYVAAMMCIHAAKFLSKKSRQLSVLMLLVAWVILSCVVGFRSWEVGIDSNQYAAQFSVFNIKQLTLRDYLAPGYTLLQFLLRLIGFNQYQYLFLVMAALTFYFLLVAIWRQSKMPSLTLFILLCFGNPLEAANQYRQFLSLCIIFFAMQFLDKDKYLEFYLLIFVASSFHISALICLLIPFFSKKKHNSLSVITRIMLSLPFFYLAIPIFKFVMNRIPYVQNYVGSQFDTATSMDNVFAFLFRLLILVWVLNYQRNKENVSSPSLGALEYGIVVQSLAVSLPVLSRLPFYGVQFASLLIPDCLYERDKRKSDSTYASLFFLIVLFLIYFIILYFQKDYQLIDYSFYWQAPSDPTAILF